MDTGRIGRLLPEFRSDISCFRRITPRINAMLWEPAGIPFNGVSRSDIGRKFSRNYPCSRPILPPQFCIPWSGSFVRFWLLNNRKFLYGQPFFSCLEKREKEEVVRRRWKPWKRIIGEDRWTRFKVIFKDDTFYIKFIPTIIRSLEDRLKNSSKIIGLRRFNRFNFNRFDIDENEIKQERRTSFVSLIVQTV